MDGWIVPYESAVSIVEVQGRSAPYQAQQCKCTLPSYTVPGGSEKYHGAMCFLDVYCTKVQVAWCMVVWRRTKLHGAESIVEVHRTKV